MLFAVALSGLALTACSEDELSTSQYGKNGVNILAFGPMPVTRGETIRLTGTKLNQVKEVLFPEGNQKLTAATTYIPGQFTLTNSEEMTVTIPDLCVPGKLRLVTNSNDTVVSASNITFAEEIKAESITPLHVHPGDIVTIKGEYVWNIAEVIFSAGVKVLAENFVKNTRNEVQVQVPMNAVTGPVTYNDGSEGAEDIKLTDKLEVDVAVATGVSNKTPEYGEEITITGENLDLVETIEFPSFGAVMEFTLVDRNTIKVVVPGTSTSGSVILTSFSGLTTSVDIEVPLISYTTGSIAPAKNLKAGQTVTLKGNNLDRVIQLRLPGKIDLEKGQFTQSMNEISFVVPEEMGDGKVVLIQHDNWTVETDKISMYAPEGPVKVIWKGNEALGWDKAGQIYLGTSGAPELVEAGAKAGDKLRIKLEPTGASWCAQIYEGHWHTQYDEIKPENYDLEGEGGYYTLTLTDELIAEFTGITGDELGWGGILLVQGQQMNVTELALVQKSDETTLWTGEMLVDDWKDQPYALSDGGKELKDAGAKVGQNVNFYITPTFGEWKLEIVEGHWTQGVPAYGAFCEVGADTENGKFTEWDLAANGGKVSIKLTQEILDYAYKTGGWGGVFVMNGDNLIVTKITLQ